MLPPAALSRGEDSVPGRPADGNHLAPYVYHPASEWRLPDACSADVRSPGSRTTRIEKDSVRGSGIMAITDNHGNAIDETRYEVVDSAE
jgi:hypothetical protein